MAEFLSNQWVTLSNQRSDDTNSGHHGIIDQYALNFFEISGILFNFFWWKISRESVHLKSSINRLRYANLLRFYKHYVRVPHEHIFKRNSDFTFRKANNSDSKWEYEKWARKINSGLSTWIINWPLCNRLHKLWQPVAQISANQKRGNFY